VFLVLSSTFLSLSVYVGTAPWQKSSVRRTPWGASSGSAPSESSSAAFFQSLLGPETHGDELGEEELRRLPWGEYQRKWVGSPERSFAWPVEGGAISSAYGMRRGRVHEGIDIAAGAGSPIRAAATGRVVFSGNVRGYGNTIVIYHGDGLASVYAHNRENLMQVGQIVSRGQTIATVGQTGRATGNHVHFELRRNGKAINPLRFHFDRDMNLSQR
jgi:murein DD-endopeptidase MepM/ murein hydrolase activator NlpD